jgi:isopenicillin-N epimerase
MGLVRLPVTQTADDALARRIRAYVMDAGCDAPVHALDGALWLRLSAFAYNEMEDYARLGDLMADTLRQS